jgi:RimJ/RimL family protein N-acetyltransferase
MAVQLFEGAHLRLTRFDPEKDAEVESRWTHDSEFCHLSGLAPALPLSATRVKKQMEERAKAMQDEERFDFALRLKAEGRLIGFVRFETLEWNNQTAWLRLAIAEASDRGKGYGSEAMNLALRYAFHELGLFRLNAEAYESNPRGVAFLERHGFVREVVRRQALWRAGRGWDEYRFGLLRPDWEARL